MTHTSTVTIIGAGLAGALTARALQDLGLTSVVLIDGAAAWTASRSPGAMLHALPGRSLDHPDEQAQAFHTATALLRAHPKEARETHMVRPLIGRQAARLRRSLEQAGPSPLRDSIRVVRGEALRRSHSALTEEAEDALVYGPAFAVTLGALVDALLEEVKARGGRVRAATAEALARRDGRWRVKLGGDVEAIESTHVVLACGAALSSWFPDLGGDAAGGTLVVARARHALDALYSANGVYACRPGRETIIGATRYPAPYPPPKAKDRARLREGAARVLPGLGLSEEDRLWRGQRWAYHADRRPLVGPIPGREGLWLMGGLGSKGLLWGPRAAERLAERLVTGAGPGASILDRERAPEDAWSSERIG